MKPGRTIYVVVGSAGEYSDRNEWLVRAFDDEEAAKAFVLRASDKARELYAERQVQWYEKGNMDWRPISEYDPHAVFATLTGREPSTDNDHEDIESMIVRYVEENSTTYRLEYTRPQTSYPVETLRVKVFTVDTAW